MPSDRPVDGDRSTPPVEGILAPNPGTLTLDGTHSWLVGSDRLLLIDPGPSLPVHLERVRSAARGRRVEAVLLTHAHADHAGGAAAAALAFGAPIMASSATLARTGLAGRVLREGDVVPVGHRTLRVIETPGHSADHISFLLLPERWLFTGDLVLGEGSSAVLHPDGGVADYLLSLRKLEGLEPERLLPGHGPPVEDAIARLQEYREHRLQRERQIEAALAAGATSVARIRELVYGPLPGDLLAAAEASVSAHLAHLRDRGIDAPEPGPGLFEPLEPKHGDDGPSGAAHA